MTEGKRRYSPSRLQTYTTCGHAYYLEKFVREPQRQAVWFIQGTAVHSAIEAYERSFRMSAPEMPLEVFEATWHLEMEKAYKEQPDESMWMVGGRRKLSTDREKRFEMGRNQVLDYIGYHAPDGRMRPAEIVPGEPAVEVGFELDFGEFLCIGYIDMVVEDQETGLWFPEDWKTGSKLPVDPFQIGTYGIALKELTGQEVPWGGYWDCRNNELVTKDLTPYTKDVVGNWYRQFHEGIKAGVFLPNPGDACFTCTVKPTCVYAA
ncbi:PD-(D/E)XK nuclease family protein [Actinomadura sp. KC216]|uniref:PD-(D/E)XK nuclease family protein n=1 Tax=Actinomadura sp. KC216 TaxID=2530370 RepID=UPI00104A6C10|nr:PD-(D/E)XK nuclease family protein [Actinomadura sp. KC216]TDB90923.1 PD-(D/E)XK nuclease family protein [Actinomadura sp. KC216]